jgi:hypothetical protein
MEQRRTPLMHDDGKEIPLEGGRTAYGVVRIGETVRRPSTISSEFTRSVLRHLEAVGFDAAPRTLGVDQSGREILSYIDGHVPTDLGWHDDDTLMAAARLIRHFHDATALLVENSFNRSVDIEVICHNDLSPCNFVFLDGLPIALIDFDAAVPGSRYWDLGYAAWLWLDLGSSDIEAAEQRRRFGVFSEAYGGQLSHDRLIETVLWRQRVLINDGRRTGNDLMVGWASKCFEWTSAHFCMPL